MNLLVEIILVDAVCAAALMLAALICERRSSELAHTLWLLAMARLMMPPIFEIALPILPSAPAATAAAPATSAPPALSASMVEASAPSLSATQMLVVGWAFGAAAFAWLALARCRRFHLGLRAGLPVDEALRDRVATIARRLGLRRAPRIVLLDEAVSPMIWSAFGPARLVLPARLLNQLSDDECDALIVHELAHLRRRDHWVRHFELLVMIAQWWNPLAWWGRIGLRRAEEASCDALALRALPEKRRAYADSLLKTMKFLAARRRPQRRVLQLALASGAGEMDRWKGRLTMILKPVPTQRLSAPWRFAATAAALLLLTISPALVSAGDGADEDAGSEVRFTKNQTTLGQALRGLAELGEFDLMVQPGLKLDESVDIDLKGSDWAGILHLIAESQNWQVSMEDSVVYVHEASVGDSGVVMSSVQSEGYDQFSGEPISMSLEEAPLSQVLDAFAKISGLTIVHDGVEGTVTVELKEVPWDQALDGILRIHRLESELVDGVLKISSPS